MVFQIYIIYEASMLSNVISGDGSVVAFGLGVLMNDFFDSVSNNKMIFVGDPCQLPPIGQPFSPALDMKWLAKKGRPPMAVTLNKIERTDPDNDISGLFPHVQEFDFNCSFLMTFCLKILPIGSSAFPICMTSAL